MSAARPVARQRGGLEGWPVLGAASAAIAVVTIAVVMVHGTGEEGLRQLVRTSARVSGLIFLAVFLASALRRLQPGDATGWLLRNRRPLGVSVGVSHGVHAVAIALFVRRTGEVADAGTLAVAGLAYAFLALMVATSFDRTAAWLGRRWWRRLHRAGLYFLWFVFGFTFLGSAGAGSAVSGAFAAAYGLALPLRLWGLRGRAR